jgi:hypothetical protein
MLMCEDDGPAYDLGWMALTTEGVNGPDEPMDHQADVSVVDNTDNNNGPAYDLGWGESTSVDPACPNVIKASSNDDASTYNLDSGDAPADLEVINWMGRATFQSPKSPPPIIIQSPKFCPPSPGAMGLNINIERALLLDGEFSSQSHSHS